MRKDEAVQAIKILQPDLLFAKVYYHLRENIKLVGKHKHNRTMHACFPDTLNKFAIEFDNKQVG